MFHMLWYVGALIFQVGRIIALIGIHLMKQQMNVLVIWDCILLRGWPVAYMIMRIRLMARFSSWLVVACFHKIMKQTKALP